MAKETISVRLDRETLDRLSVIAKATGRTRGALLTYAIEKYVETEAWQVAAIQDAVDELERSKADLADHEDVAAWLNSWGTDNEAESRHANKVAQEGPAGLEGPSNLYREEQSAGRRERGPKHSPGC